MGSLWPSLFFLIGIIASATSDPFYTVIAPQIVRPNSEYHVALSTYDISWSARILIKLTAVLYSGGTYNVSKTATVEPHTTRIVKLETGDAADGTYQLIAKGLSGIEFYNITYVQFVRKHHSILIQTDRAIYKPSTKVLFRVVVLDERLRPAKNGTELLVYVTDPDGNRVNQWKQRMDGKGVFSGEIQLSEQPIFGNWRIFAAAFEETVQQSFEVAEYVLPKFEVVIDVPSNATLKDSVITVNITAKYTYGKPVKGIATISAYPNYYSFYLPPTAKPAARKVVPIDGTVSVDFDILFYLWLQGEWERPIHFVATVEEELTGRSQNGSGDMTLYKDRYSIDLIRTADSYKPGLRYTVFVRITNHDGSPVQDKCNDVKIWYGYNYNRTLQGKIRRKLDADGMIQLDFYPPPNTNSTESGLYIVAKYLGVRAWLGGSSPALSPSGTYIQANLITENPTVGEDIEIEVNSTVPLKYISYDVVGHGDILIATSVKGAKGKTVTFSFPATNAMAPTVIVIVYYLRDDGEVVADSLSIPLGGVLQNFVDIAITPQQVKPGENVDLVITSRPNSFIGLLGVDRSSILLKSGNDITREKLRNELSYYDVGNSFFSSDSTASPPSWSPGSSNAYDVFSQSGVIIFTDGILYRPTYYFDYFRGSGSGRGGGGGGGGIAAASNGAAGDGSGGGQPSDTGRVRRDFPETWIWQMVDAGSDGKTILKKTVPDTITTWVLTAFTVDEVYGFGLIDGPRNLTVFQPFFVSLDLPYSVIRGEIVAISIVVFNYLDRNVTAQVILENDGQFVFVDAPRDGSGNPRVEPSRNKTIRVNAASGTSVSFLIIPKVVGNTRIRVTAISALARDTIEQQLLVKPEGETHYVNTAVFVDLRRSRSFATSVEIIIPENSVPGSEHVEVSAVGDILGATLLNIANLIRMPWGCGEQVLLTFVPNIIVLDYLKGTNRLTPDVERRAIQFLQVGYQRELGYHHYDGSFSAFGMLDAQGSTWLTAFVLKSFIQAAKYILIEDRIIDGAFNWLVEHQAKNGSFPEVGTVVHQDIQGGGAKGLALTAFTLIAFLENPANIPKYNGTIDKGIDYIAQNFEGIDDVYAICLCAYVLNVAKHPKADTAFKLMLSRSQSEPRKDHLWWSKPVPRNDENPWYSMPRSVNVEMTSYALLTYLRRNMVVESLPIMKWLVTQRNSYGGFASSQDTIIGTYALAKLAIELYSERGNMDILFRYENGGEVRMNVNAGNSIVLQKQDLPRRTREVNISATGNGFAITQVSYNYNLNDTGVWPSFLLNVQVDKRSTVNYLQLTICTSFIPTKDASESNMAIMEVSFPSGFAFDLDTLPGLKTTQHVKRVETKNADTLVVLYFDKLVKEQYCVTIFAYRKYKVAEQKPVPVVVYDYYDSSRRATEFYELMATTVCDICEGIDCGNACTR